VTPEEYFNDHIPYRVNLLTTFRERYGPDPRRPGFTSGQPRDLFLCSRNISILMVRFFCEEMGLYLPVKGPKDTSSDLRERATWVSVFNIQRFREAEATNDPRYPALLLVMEAANRVAAHLEGTEVNYPSPTEKDDPFLLASIGWIEELIQSHIYKPNRRFLSDAMALAHNAM
jgi:hypothetical protein